MADTRTQDVVKQAQSAGDSSPADVSGRTQTSTGAGGAQEQPSKGETQNASEVPKPITNGIDSRTDVDGEAPSSGMPTTQDGPSNKIDEPHVNGIDTASYTESDDNYQRSADGDNQQDGPSGPDELNWRQRSNSFAKKATAFKSVSVTKNYLAKSGSAVPNVVKTALDTGATGGLTSMASASAAKPRLVNKLGRNKLSHATIGSPVAGGPDASKVWNRNRPAPAQPPKQFTDEELKQQYGIHMATRLQADDANKESKWADIDDDEDDWAPETVQWMDGTKSTLLAEKILPVTTKPVQSQERPNAGGTEPDQKPPTPQILQPTGLSSAGKAILKPGIRSTSNTVQTKPGLALKAVPETSNAPAKQSSFSSGKSPWAQLPVIDKASPIVFEPPQNMQRPYAFRQDSSAIDDLPAPSPAKEIAADDFDRSWRDNDRGSQTLFNSQSGRYEPVKGGRRSSRNESGFRPPSVLQRPSLGQAQMEPFQSREGQPWSRRRESSHDNNRPSSFTTQQEPAKPVHIVDPAISDAQNEQENTAHSQTNHAQADPPTDPRVEQQRLMRERIERNRARKEEEAAKEEAAKQERIRQRLAALTPLEEKAGAAAIVDNMAVLKHEPRFEDVPTIDSSSIDQPPVDPPTGHLNLQKISSPSSLPPSSLSPSSKTSPTIPYTHSQLATDKTTTPAHNTLQSTFGSTKPSTSIPHFAQASSDNTSHLNKSPELTALPGLGQPAPDLRQNSTWNRNQQSPWSNRSAQMPTMTSTNTSTWGSAATNDRNLGNGAFGMPVSRGPSMQTSANQAPIGTSYVNNNRGSPHTTPSPPVIGTGRRSGAVPIAQMSIAGGTANENAIRGSSVRRHRPVPMQANAEQEAGRAAWAAYPDQVDAYDEQIHEDALERANNDFVRLMAERRATGKPITTGPTITETYKATGANAKTGARRVVTKHETIVDEDGDQATSAVTAQPIAPQAPLHPVPNGRTSRFFGPAADRTQPSPIAPPVVAQPVESEVHSCEARPPPPPETFGHPAFDFSGNTGPLVRLPTTKPTVRLPPQNVQIEHAALQTESTVTMPANHPGVKRPLAQNENWEARFKGLFADRGKPQASGPRNVKTSTMAPQTAVPIDSATKAALLRSPEASSATVSFPTLTATSASQLSRLGHAADDAQTKPCIEPLMDERIDGSLPRVSMPRGAQPRDSQVLEPADAAPAKGQKYSGGAEWSKKWVTTKDELTWNDWRNARVYIDGKPPGGKLMPLPGKALTQQARKTKKPKQQSNTPNSTVAAAATAAAATAPTSKKPSNAVDTVNTAAAKPQATGPAKDSATQPPIVTSEKAPEVTSTPSSSSAPQTGIAGHASTSGNSQQQQAAVNRSAWPKAPKAYRDSNRRGGHRPVSVQRQAV